MGSIRQAIIYSSASKYVMRVIGLISTVLIARLLTPEEIGTFAIASAIVMVMGEFRLLGAGSWLVREAELSSSKIRRALGLTMLMSWGMGFGILAISHFVAAFYEIADISTIFKILALSFFLAPFISIPSALLSRDFDFRALFFIRLLSILAGLAVTVILIFRGYSYFSLAWGYTANVIVELLSILLFSRKRCFWRPLFYGLGPVAAFGVYSSIANLLKRAVITAPDMIIGKMGTPFQVGIFSRGLGFVDFASQTLIAGVGPVVLPYLSETKRSEGNLKEAYLRACVLMGAMVWPVLGVVSVASLPTILFFFGTQWVEAAPIATWLALWAMLRTVHWFSSDLFIAAGKEKLMAVKESIVFFSTACLIIMAFPSGLNFLAKMFVLAGLIDFLVSASLVKRLIGLGIIEFLRSWTSNALVTASCVTATYLIGLFVPFNSDKGWLALLLIAGILPFVWIFSLYLFRNHLFNEFRNLVLRKRYSGGKK